MNSVEFLGKQVSPSKIVCVGRNYADHARELGNDVPTEPVIFMKPNSSISSTLSSSHQEALHYEAELSFLIQNGTLSGVGVGLDLTKRGLQSTLKAASLPWERAKAFDGAAVFSSFVALDFPLDDLRFTLSVDGVLRQSGETQHMLFSPNDLLRYISEFSTLQDNDIVMTGTPAGVGELVSGCDYEVTLYAEDVYVLSHRWCAV